MCKVILFKRRLVAFKGGFVRRSVGLSSKYFQKVLKERFLNLIDVRLVIIRLREASLSVVLSVGFQKFLKN